MVDYFLPGYNAGGPIQSVANLSRLLKTDYNFWILTRNHDFLSTTTYEEVPHDKWVEREPGIQVFYTSDKNRSYSAFKKIIGGLDGIDFMYCNSLYSPGFSFKPQLVWFFNRYPFKRVLAPRGEVQAGAIKMKSTKKKLYIQLYKLLGLHKSMIWHATDAQEVLDIKKYFGKNSTVRVSQNVPKFEQLDWQATPKEKGTVRFALVSRLHEKKNFHFFIEQLKDIKGQVIFDLFGISDDPEYWKKCEKIIQTLPANIQVNLKGAVPNTKVLAILQDYHFFVLSTVGENFGHSIFEGLLAGKPVLISDRTPWRNLESQNVGWDIPLEDPKKWQQVIQDCTDMDQATYAETSKAAWHYAKNFTDLKTIKASLQKLFS